MATILLVDDYAPNHRLMRFVLERSGHAVVTAFDGQQALDQLTIHAVDLIVTDMLMPTMDGIALAHAIRGDLRYKHLPIMFVTASSTIQEQLRAADLGVNSFLTKPIDSAEIVREVDRLIAYVRDSSDIERLTLFQTSLA